ncbi:MAG TPA: VWA domain-containing protein [Thermoanaerobaculia bacterium]|nr:VWA domain-containing protein [Thermoanaerobaculia bacterium]
MREKCSLALGVLAVLAVLSSAPLAAQSASGFGEVVQVDVVNVDAYVTDKDGKPVAGLGKNDFEVFEDGKRVEVTNFEAVDRARPAGSPAPASPSPLPEAAAALREDGLHLVVYIDNFNLRTGNRSRAVRQLREFLTRQLVPGDRVLIVTYDLGLSVRLPFTGDPAAISAALDRLEKLTVQGEEDDRAKRQAFQAMMDIQTVSLNSPIPIPCPLDIVTPAHSYAAAKRQEVKRTFGALTVLVNSLSGVPGRKALLHVSDGISFTPGEELFQFLYEICGGGGAVAGFGASVGPDAPAEGRGNTNVVDDPANTIYDSRMIGPQAYQAASQAAMDAQSYSVANDVQSLAAHANAHRVTLYTLQASGAESGNAADASYGPNERLFQIPSIAKVDLVNRQGTLTALASATGGRAILDTTDFLPDLSRMREDFDRYYSLGYTPSHSGDGKEHRIEVKLKRPGLKVRSRQSYRDKPALERTVDRTLAALFYDVQENPLEVAMEVGAPTPDARGQYLVPVNLRIPLFKLGILNDQGVYRGKLRLLVASRNEKGMTPVRQIEVPLEIPREQVLMAMGKYYAYSLSLQMLPGEQLIAIAVRDETTTTTSYLARSVQVGAAGTPGPGSSAR